MARRFGILQCRFVEFSEQVHTLLRTWLSRQQVEHLEISLDSLANYLFSLEGIQTCPVDAMQHWLKTIARCALEDQLSCVPYTRYGSSGTTVVFSNIPSTLFVEWPKYSRTSIIAAQPADDVASLRERNSMLEVRARELEVKLAAETLVPKKKNKSHHHHHRDTKLPSSSSSSTTAPQHHHHRPLPATCTAESTYSFLLEKRFEAEDAISTLQRVQAEFVERRRVLEMLNKDQTHRFVERRRADKKRARYEMALAMDEITRLRAEVERLKALNSAAVSTTVQSNNNNAQAGAAAAVDPCPIVPRRALKIAGFWGVSHNDILLVTPHLVKKFESMAGGGKIIRQKNMQEGFLFMLDPYCIFLFTQAWCFICRSAFPLRISTS